MDLSAYASNVSSGLCLDYSVRVDWVNRMFELCPDVMIANKKGEPTAQRHREFAFILYLDNPLHVRGWEYLQQVATWDYVAVLHELDVDFDKTKEALLIARQQAIDQGMTEEVANDIVTVDNVLKKPHIHVLIRVKSACTNSAILKELSYFQPMIEKGSLSVSSFADMVAYFVHRTPKAIAEDKHMYEWKDLDFTSRIARDVEKVMQDYDRGKVSGISELIDTINVLAENYFEPNDVLKALSQTEYGYFITRNYVMVNNTINNALKSSNDIRASVRASKDIYNRSYDNYTRVCMRIIRTLLKPIIKKQFNIFEIDTILRKYSTTIQSRVSFADGMCDIFADILFDYLKPSIEDLDAMMSRLDKQTDNYFNLLCDSIDYLRQNIIDNRTNERDLYNHCKNLVHTAIKII